MIEIIVIFACLATLIILGGTCYACVHYVQKSQTSRAELDYSQAIEAEKTKRMVVQAQIDQQVNENLKLEIRRRELELGPGQPIKNKSPFDI